MEILQEEIELLMPAFPERYRILEGNIPMRLASEVNQLAHEGWEVYGYMTISPEGTFYQVMVKLDRKTRASVS